METSHGSTLTRYADADESSSFAYFQKTDCWLLKADDDFDGKRLAVAGFTSKEKGASRVFYSAPIIKRYDDFTRETADGIVVILGWFINKSRTTENGFPDDVSIQFLFGFPPHWEEYADKCFKQAVNSDTDLPNTVELNESMVEPDATNRIKCAIVNFSSPKAAFRNLDESITRVEADVTASSTTERDTVMASRSNSRHGNGHKPSRNVNDIQRPKLLTKCSMKHKGKGLISGAFKCLDEGNLKSSSKSHVNPPKKVDSDISEAMLRASSRLRSLSGKSKSSKKSENIVPKERGSSRKQAKRKISFDAHATPIHERKERKYILTPESLSLERSRSGRLLLPTLDFWRNQIPVYDAGRNITGVQEELAEMKPSTGSKSETSWKRKR